MWDGLAGEVVALSHLRSVLFASAVIVNDLSMEIYGAGAWPIDRSAYPDPSWGGLSREAFESRVDEITSRSTQAHDALSENSIETKLDIVYSVDPNLVEYAKKRAADARKRIHEARQAVVDEIERYRVT